MKTFFKQALAVVAIALMPMTANAVLNQTQALSFLATANNISNDLSYNAVIPLFKKNPYEMVVRLQNLVSRNRGSDIIAARFDIDRLITQLNNYNGGNNKTALISALNSARSNMQ